MNWGWVRTGAAGLSMVLLLVALPLLFSKQVYAIVFTPKAVVVYLGAATLAVALAAAALERGGIELRLTVVELLALALAGWGLVSALFAVSRVTGFFGLLNWGTGWLFWLACLVIWAAVRRLDFSERGRLAALWTGFAMASVLGLLALLQVVGTQSVVSWLPAMVAGRPGATIGNPIYFGAYMALLLLVGLELTVRARDLVSAVACTVGLVLVTVGLVANLSRGPWLGAAAGVVVWAGLGLRRRDVRGAVIAPLVVVLVTAGLFAWQLPHLSDAGLSVGARTEGGTAVVAPTGEPNTIATRVELWKVAAGAMRERPLLGWGPGNFVTAGRQHMTARLVAAEQVRFADAHNLYADFGATWGAPGLLLLLVWLVAVAAQLWRAEWLQGRPRSDAAGTPGPGEPTSARGGAKAVSTGRHGEARAAGAGGKARRGRTAVKAGPAPARRGAAGAAAAIRQPRGLASLGLAALVTYAVSSLSAPQQVTVLPTAMLIVGLSISWREASRLPGTRVLTVWADRSRGAAIAALVASVVLLGVVIVGSSRFVRADAHYGDAVRAASSVEALAAYQAAADSDPWVERYWISLGDMQSLLVEAGGDAELSHTAEASLRRGLSLSPRDLEGLLSLSRVLLDRGDTVGARRVAEQAVSYAPYDARTHANLAWALAVAGDREAARATLDKAPTAPGDARWLLLAGLAYKELGDATQAVDLLSQLRDAGHNDPLVEQALAELGAAR